MYSFSLQVCWQPKVYVHAKYMCYPIPDDCAYWVDCGQHTFPLHTVIRLLVCRTVTSEKFYKRGKYFFPINKNKHISITMTQQTKCLVLLSNNSTFSIYKKSFDISSRFITLIFSCLVMHKITQVLSVEKKYVFKNQNPISTIHSHIY